jgi:uncharacterized protein YbcI
MKTKTFTRGQLERKLSQQIQAMYHEQLGHRPGKVSCELFDQKLAVLIEDSFTPAERLLAQEGRQELAEEVRSDLDEVIKPKLKHLIEDVLGIDVIDILSDATLETGRSGIIAVLSDIPEFREPRAKAFAHNGHPPDRATSIDAD